MTLNAFWTVKDVQVSLGCELNVQRIVLIPTPGERFIRSAAPIWRDTRFATAGILRIAEQQRELIDTSLDLLVNDYLQANP